MKIVTVNLRYLLWKHGIKQVDWISGLASWAKCSEARAEDLLNGANLLDHEQKAIAETTNYSEEDIQTARFLGENIDIFQENIKFLIDKESTGLKQIDIAKGIGIKDVTLTRWKKGEQKPDEIKLAKICEYFKLPYGTNLKEDPIFLSPYPLGDLNRRNWLKKMIEKIDSETLSEIFPALRRLLKER